MVATTGELKKDTAPPIAKPHSFLFHPHMTILDMIVQLLARLLLPLKPMLKVAPIDRSKDAIASLNATRAKFLKMNAAMLKPMLKLWSDQVQCPIAEYEFQVPVIPDIIKKWGIVKDDIELPVTPRETVTVVCRFPSSILPSEIKTTETEHGTLKVEQDLDLSTFGMDVPLMLHFHGGGMVLGETCDIALLEEVGDLAKASLKQEGKDGR